MTIKSLSPQRHKKLTGNYSAAIGRNAKCDRLWSLIWRYV